MKKAAPLHPLPTPKTSWEKISINVIGPLPKSEDKDAILVVVDQFSKMLRLMATITSIFSSKVARIYRDNIWNGKYMAYQKRSSAIEDPNSHQHSWENYAKH